MPTELWLWPLVGGAILGVSASLLMLFGGQILGISGILAGVMRRPDSNSGWRFAFVAGLLAGGFLMLRANPESFVNSLDRSTWAIVLAGLLVGFGTRIGGGCTSGHGICGIGRLSPRSIVATCTFMLTGALVAYAVNHLLAGAL